MNWGLSFSFILLYCAIAHPATAAVSVKDFTVISHQGTTYWLSKTSANTATATDNCKQIGAKLALFDSDLDYKAMYTVIKPYNQQKVIVDVIQKDDNNDKFLEYYWQNEKFSGSTLLGIYYDIRCNKSNGDRCCIALNYAYVVFLSQSVVTIDCGYKFPYLCEQTTGGGSGNGVVCSPGLKLDNVSDSCVDIDECGEVLSPCQQVCNNTIGSFVCGCEEGYVVNVNDSTICDDVDECGQASKPCQQVCSNTNGSYVCGCYTGYVVNTNNTSWCVDVDECATVDGSCHMCNNTNGSYVCSCKVGYTLAVDKHTCTDVDECAGSINRCQHMCNNTVGSYRCSCESGYILSNDSFSCVDVNECGLTDDCEQLCNNTIGSFTCSCLAGFNLHPDNKLCDDINECEISNPCQYNCTNTNGSYTCLCPSGYSLDTDGYSCVDINECQESLISCDGTCINTNGSYTCSCGPGYLLDSRDNITCLDINECATKTADCDHICINTIGSYLCKCNSTYTNTSDPNCFSFPKYAVCYTTCAFQIKMQMITMVKVLEEVEQRESKLLLDKKNLSSYIETISCAEDPRTSAETMGDAGIAVLVFVFGVIVVADLVTAGSYCFEILKHKFFLRRRHITEQ